MHPAYPSDWIRKECRSSRTRYTLVLRRCPTAGCRFSSKTSCIFTLILQRAKVSKYHQSIKIRFSTQNIKISAVSTPIFARISPFFCLFNPNILEKMRQNVKKCKNLSHQISEIFRNSAKNGHILISWLYFIPWYFAGFLHFHFEICENLQPATCV